MEIVVISCKQFVTVEAIKSSLVSFLESTVGIDSDNWYITRVSPLGKKFYLKFIFLPLGNARIAEKVFANLRTPEGEWREFLAPLVDGSRQKIRLDRHENPKERAMRAMGAMAKRAVLAAKPDLEDVHHRRDRRLDTVILYASSGRGIPLCSMVPERSDIEANYFKWNYEGLEELQLSRDDLINRIQGGQQPRC